MDKNRTVKRQVYKRRSMAATGLVIIIIAVLFGVTYFQIQRIVRENSLKRLEETVQIVMEEIYSMLDRDSVVLDATAEIISDVDLENEDAVIAALGTVNPLMKTMDIRILMPDDRVISPDGTVLDVSERVDFNFAEESAQGEHITDRVEKVEDGSQVLRHMIPIIRDGKTAAMLYGIISLDEFPDNLNIRSIYNGRASTYIIDTRTGDFILDTYPSHKTLMNISDMDTSDRETRGETNWAEYTESMLAQESGYVVYRTPRTVGWEYMYYRPVGINQWSISISVPESEVFSVLWKIRGVAFVVALILVMAIAVYMVFLYCQMKRQSAETVARAVLEEKLKKAEAAERAKTAFLSNMSHDIRTPMNAIIGFTTLAETNLDNKPRVQEYLAKILSSSNHLLSLINDILDMSRIESGRLNIEEKPCSISDIFRDVRNIMQTQMQSKQLNFFMDTMDVLDEEIYCDKLHVNQVLLNLLSNAIKFTPAGGSVSLLVQQKPGAPKGYGVYEIHVKDTGIGMSREFVQHIFEPFERERTSTVSGIQGTGLGMAITKSIVDAMSGTIQVKTEQNRGTEFIVTFTFRLQSETRQVSVVKELAGVRGLVVDDSFSTCDSVTKMLAQIGMRAEWTMYGREAVLRARQAVEMGDEFYAYIIDWALPDLSGLEVVRQVRAIVGENAPIIILTAYDWTAFEEEAKKAGVTSFCNKPIFLSELRDTLVSALGKTDTDNAAVDGVPDPMEQMRGLRLLLVEDNELNREIAQELLTEKGFLVETAEDGTVAVEMVSRSEPGYYVLVLMDVQMPIMNGYDATRAIRALEDPRLSSVPIVAMTANAFDEDQRKALECGMNAHVAKPIDVAKLMKVLFRILGGSD